MRIPGPLLPARFLSRPNRFLAIVELDGAPVRAHLPDPGRLKELLLPGARVWVRPVEGGTRKTEHTLTLVETADGELVSLVTTFPNEMVAEALEGRRIAELSGWRIERREHSWGESRFDFLLVGRDKWADRRMLLEVKSVTLVEGRRALFPDAVTARGARHVRELARAVGAGLAATLLFVVQRQADSVTAAGAIDPVFAEALEAARRGGVRLLGYRCRVTIAEARLTEPIPVKIGETR